MSDSGDRSDSPAEAREPTTAERLRELQAIGDLKAFDPRTKPYDPLEHVAPKHVGDRVPDDPPPTVERPQLRSLLDRIRDQVTDRFDETDDPEPTEDDAHDRKDIRSDAERLGDELEPEVDQPNTGDDPEHKRVWQTIADEIGEVRSYRNYRTARDDLGTREGEQIHHVVEQSQALPHRSGFDLERINTTDNLVRLPREVHERITAEYNSKVPGLDIKLRDTMDGLSFEEQWRIGAEIVDGAYEKMKGKLDER